jgi:hypothetical protein
MNRILTKVYRQASWHAKRRKAKTQKDDKKSSKKGK